MKKYFRVLGRCVALSGALLAISHFRADWPKLTVGLIVGSSLIPLIYYHRWLTTHADDQSGAAIDSVYYFGFLLTVCALAFSAIDVSLRPHVELPIILYNFGLGLAATGYAVIARMHLLSRVMDDTTATGAINQYVDRTGILLNELELAATRIRTFGEMVQQEAQRAQIDAMATARNGLDSAASAFQTSLNNAVTPAVHAVGELRELVRDTTFRTEREELVALIADTGKAAKRLNAALEYFAAQATGGSAAAAKASDQLTAIGTAADSVSDSLQQLASGDGALSGAVSTIRNAAGVAAQATVVASTSLTALEGIGEALGGAGSAIKDIRRFAESAATQLGSVTSKAQQLDAAMAELLTVASRSTDIARALADSSHELPQLTRDAQGVHASMDALRHAIAQSAASLQEDVTRSANASQLLTQSLTNVANTIVDSTRSRERMMQ
jgi:hypothetical protein